jgi:hypothetical protein
VVPVAHFVSESLISEETPFHVFSGSDFRSLLSVVKSLIGIWSTKTEYMQRHDDSLDPLTSGAIVVSVALSAVSSVAAVDALIAVISPDDV